MSWTTAARRVGLGRSTLYREIQALPLPERPQRTIPDILCGDPILLRVCAWLPCRPWTARPLQPGQVWAEASHSQRSVNSLASSESPASPLGLGLCGPRRARYRRVSPELLDDPIRS